MDAADEETRVLRERFASFHRNFLTFVQYKREDEAIFTFGVLTGMYTNRSLAGEPIAGDPFTLALKVKTFAEHEGLARLAAVATLFSGESTPPCSGTQTVQLS
jgi:hypothetical protein